MKEHLRDIRTNKNTPVAYHFNSVGHSTDDFQIEVISYVYLHVPPNSPEGYDIRRLIEKKWIHKLKTSHPHGLNIMD